MNVTWLGTVMLTCWGMTLIGGLGSHVMQNFNGKRLEAYCRLRRRPDRYGDILDGHEQAAVAAQYFMVFAVVLGSLAAGAWFYTNGEVEVVEGHISSAVAPNVILAWIISWLLLLTLAGLWLPRIVVHYSSSLFLFHSWPVWRTLAFVTRPFYGFGDVFSWLGYRLSDERDGDDLEEEVLEDEIRTMVAAGQREGVFAAGVSEMIQGVMDLDEADVEEIMTPRSSVDAIDLATSWQDVLAAIADCGRTRIPIFDGTLDNVVGILYVKDVLSVVAKEDFKPEAATLRSLLRKPWFIPGSMKVDELLRVFLHNRNHIAIVIDEYRQFAGVVTIEDALEEIVGEISDELDTEEESDLTYDEDRHVVEAEGKVPVESIGDLLGLQLPDSDDYDTIGGLIVHRLSRIPQEGTELEVEGLKLTVLRANSRMIQRVKLELLEADSQ